MNAEITIIIPIYNGEYFLEKCIRSIVNQTLKNIEIILVNDGSTDNSLDICNEWSKSDKRIKVINKKNEGVSSARNIGIMNANGKYIGFVDCDDYVDEKMYEILLDRIKKDNSDIAICEYVTCKKDKNIIKENKYKENIIEKEKIIPMFLQGKILNAYLWNKLYKKELFNNLKFNNYNMLEDMDIMYLILEKCKKISYINKEYYYHISYNNMSLTKKYSLSMINDFQSVIFKMFKHYDNRNDIKDYLNYDKIILICILFTNIAKSKVKLSKIISYRSVYEVFKTSLKELKKSNKNLYNEFSNKEKLKIILLNINKYIYIILIRIIRRIKK